MSLQGLCHFQPKAVAVQPKAVAVLCIDLLEGRTFRLLQTEVCETDTPSCWLFQNLSSLLRLHPSAKSG